MPNAALNTDVRIAQTQMYLLPVTTRVPLKFGAETVTSVHDAYGQLHEVDIYETYNGDWMSRDLSDYLASSDDSVSYQGLYPQDFLVETPPKKLDAWHLVGGQQPEYVNEILDQLQREHFTFGWPRTWARSGVWKPTRRSFIRPRPIPRPGFIPDSTSDATEPSTCQHSPALVLDTESTKSNAPCRPRLTW